MNISLTENLEKFVTEKVESGLYNSASEVIRDGLRLLIEKEEQRVNRLQSLEKEITIGMNQLSRGEVISAEDALSHISQKSRNKPPEGHP